MVQLEPRRKSHSAENRSHGRINRASVQGQNLTRYDDDTERKKSGPDRNGKRGIENRWGSQELGGNPYLLKNDSKMHIAEIKIRWRRAREAH